MPDDPTATEAAIVDLAEITCEKLDSAISINDLIDAVAEDYGGTSTAREVLRLLVSYGCPNNLEVFD